MTCGEDSRSLGGPPKRQAAGVVYLITNVVNGKCYVGITKALPDRRWAEHRRAARRGDGHALHWAIRRHNVQNFRFEVIASAATILDLIDAERLLIVQYGSFGKRGYNLTPGGEGTVGFSPTLAQREKMSVAKRGRQLRPEHAAKIAAALTGKPKSEAHKKKLRSLKRPDVTARLAGKPRAPKTVTKLKVSLKGRRPAQHTVDAARAAWPKGSTQSPEARAKIAAAQKGRVPSAATIAGVRAAHAGRSKSPEQRAKIAAALRLVWERRGSAAFGR